MFIGGHPASSLSMDVISIQLRHADTKHSDSPVNCSKVGGYSDVVSAGVNKGTTVKGAAAFDLFKPSGLLTFNCVALDIKHIS